MESVERKKICILKSQFLHNFCFIILYNVLKKKRYCHDLRSWQWGPGPLPCLPPLAHTTADALQFYSLYTVEHRDHFGYSVLPMAIQQDIVTASSGGVDPLPCSPLPPLQLPLLMPYIIPCTQEST